MNTFLKYTFILLLGGLFFNCTGNFDEMNTNPNTVTEIDPSLLLPKMQAAVIDANANEYQRGENLYSNQYCQWVSNSASYFASDRYVYNSDWSTAAYWLPYYTYILKNLRDIKDMADKYPKYQEMYQIARIVAAVGAARTTDIFGDVPYSEGGTGLDKPKYDAQKDIYYDILNELKEATTALKAGFPEEQVGYGSQDLYFNGDVNKWIKLGNSLRLRYALRISFVDPDKAKQEGESALGQTMMGSIDDNAYFIQNINDNGGFPMFVISNWGEFRLSSTLENAYKTLSSVVDPRMEFYWGVTQQSVDDGAPDIKGIRNGIPSDQLPPAAEASSCWGLLWAPTWNSAHVLPTTFSITAPLYIMCYSEVCFLKAEAAIRGWSNAGSAQTEYENGIRASFAEARLDVATNLYSTANDDVYIKTGSVKWDDAANFETKLEKVATQKWISLFPNGTEGWAETRRTGYPKLQPVVRSDAPAINPANGEFIKKLRYVDMELNSNSENANSPSLNGGKGDGINVRVWWDTGRYK